MIKSHFEIIDTVSSTNLILKLKAKNEPQGKVIIANTQTAGRGRVGRSFYSPAGSGLYMSILLKPQIPPEETLLITPCAAVAVCESIEALSGRTAGIKWVNDVFVDGKKVCGILTESSISDNTLDFAVLGIGVNLYDCGFPSELSGIAGAVFEGAANGFEMRDKMAKLICERFFTYYENLTQRAFLDAYRRRSIVTGKRIKVLSPASPRTATALYISDSCGLAVEFDDGAKKILSSGEVSIRLDD